MSDQVICPCCGQRRERWENGIVRGARGTLACSRPEWAGLDGPASAAGWDLDRLMSWMVGLLLLASVAVLTVFQVSGPR
jgi:hypothetical protein